jgi:general secretion pathway protein D
MSSPSVFESLAQAGSVTVAVSPPSITASVGQDFSVDINILSVSDLYGWEFKLGWNESLLGLVSVDEGPFLRSGGNTFFTYLLNTTEEHIVVDCTLEGQIQGVSGNGTLATVTFSTTTVGECPLNLYDVILLDSNAQQISCSAVGGYGNFTSAVQDMIVAGGRVPYLA